MADTRLWRSWQSRVEWDADATVPQDVCARLAAFLEQVWAAMADLTAAVTDATDDDLIAVLGPRVLNVPGPARARLVAALAGLVADRLEAALDGPDANPAAEVRLHARLLTVTRVLEGKAPAVQWAIVAVLLERVLRALLASPESEDPDALEPAADVLEDSMIGLLQEVSSRAIPPEAYHIM